MEHENRRPMTFITTVQQDANQEDYFIEIPDEICKEFGWKEGDIINWDIKEDNSATLTKVEEHYWYTTKEKEINYYIQSQDT